MAAFPRIARLFYWLLYQSQMLTIRISGSAGVSPAPSAPIPWPKQFKTCRRSAEIMLCFPAMVRVAIIRSLEDFAFMLLNLALAFHGAAGCTTGSRHLLSIDDKNI